MSESTEEPQADPSAISDDQLPEDLQPGEDNPLAEPLDPDAEGTKDADELGMDDTQDDTTGVYRSEGELGDRDTTTADAEDDSDD
ncbi:hypothetical protein [Nocardioides sp.]|uniref:hypothetical protein n=1 Tax=Nocardioides sp. TaxID=35761 RepID=UPI00286DCFDA|nr:hypothetical protein [Nocardioides sp.]